MKAILLSFILIATGGTFAADPSDPNQTREQLLQVARSYLKGQLVNPGPRVAPTQCWIPPTRVLYSEAKPGRAHGGKLFYLFARDSTSLAQKEKVKTQPVGQCLVKESWVAEPLGTEKPGKAKKHASGKHLSSHTTHKGKTLAIGDPLDLYIMLKQDPKTKGTDEGWVYAVVSRDAQSVLHAGRIQSCIDCHEDAKYDRILGDYPPPDKRSIFKEQE